MSARHPIVGAWWVTVEVGGNRGPDNLASFGADGNVLVASPSPTPAAPDAGHQVEFWTPALGSWSATGDNSASMRFVTLGTAETGASAGSHTIAADVAVAADGSSWAGTFELE